MLCDLPMLPRYMSEAVSVAVFTMLAGAARLIGPGEYVAERIIVAFISAL